MQSKVKTVDAYLGEVPAERKAILGQLREACSEVLEGYEEGMYYGMPSYKIAKNEPEIAFASQKNYISLYILKQGVLDVYRERFKKPGITMGKGCIRFSKPEKIDLDLVRELLTDSAHSDSEIC